MFDKAMLPKYICRPSYLERLRPYVDTPLIKVLTGQRRVGKSYILFQLIAELLDRVPAESIIYINKELHEFSALRTGEDLYGYIKSQLPDRGPAYVCIDEIQDIAGFEHALRSLLASRSCDMYCTGSNANLLSGELATYLAGRHMEIPIHSLSYAEFLEFHRLRDTPDAIQSYLRYGGMPYLSELVLEDSVVFEYLRNVYESILFRDVVAREKIRNVGFLESLTEYLADNVGSRMSANNISKYLKSQRVSIPVQTVITYLDALRKSFFVHRVQRSEIHGLRLFEMGEKYYFEDLGLRNVLRRQSRNADAGKLVENAVYLHLIQSGFDVHIGQDDGREIDFVCERAGRRIYVQASYVIGDAATAQREFGNLLRIRDNHPKYVVTMDQFIADPAPEGILHLRLNDFLLTTPEQFIP